MIIDESTNINQLVYSFILSLPRIIVFIQFLPFFTESLIPNTIKWAFSVSLSLAVFPIVFHTNDFSTMGIAPFMLLVIKELIYGLFFVFFVSIPIWAISVSGFLIDLQRGASSASLFTPFFTGTVSAVGILFVQSVATLLLVSGGFLVLIDLIYQSYLFIPISSASPTEYFSPTLFIKESARIFSLAFSFAAPMIIMMFCVDLTLGIANRFSPEINVFFISMPVKSILAIFLLVLYYPFLMDEVRQQIENGITQMESFIKL